MRVHWFLERNFPGLFNDFWPVVEVCIIPPRKNVYYVFVFIHVHVVGLLVGLFIFSCVPLVTTFCSSCRSVCP